MTRRTRVGSGRRPGVAAGLLAAVCLGCVANGPSIAPAPASPVATASASASGLPAATPSPSPTPSADVATFDGGGLSFSYPATWRVWRSETFFMTGSSIAIVGNGDLSACGKASVDVNCAYAARFAPGEVRVFVGTAASAGGSVKEPEGGFTRFVDGMPVVEREIGPLPQTGQDGTVTWQIGMPGAVDNWYVVEAGIRGPGSVALRAEAEALVASIRFDHPAPSLPTDPAAIDALVATTVDALDRDARESYHSRFYACFPRKVGASDPTVITDGPGGPLASPVEVTCSIVVRPLEVGLFEIELDASWPSGPGYAAGTVRSFVTVDGDGKLGEMRNPNDTWFPVTEPATPAPATTPIALAPGSLVVVLYPGVQFWADTHHGDALSDAPFGQRLWIVSGPVSAGGESWYRVQWQPTPTYDGIAGWMADTFEGHPVVEPAKPRCPDRVMDVAQLTDLHPAERLLCFGARPIDLGHVWFETKDNATFPATGTPAWLAGSASVLMFGSTGPNGVDPALLARGGPAAGDLPLNTWLTVTGHFDDPAAGSCTRRWWGDPASTPLELTAAEQVLTCREQFVITSFRSVAAP